MSFKEVYENMTPKEFADWYDDSGNQRKNKAKYDELHKIFGQAGFAMDDKVDYIYKNATPKVRAQIDAIVFK